MMSTKTVFPSWGKPKTKKETEAAAAKKENLRVVALNKQRDLAKDNIVLVTGQIDKLSQLGN